MGLFSGLLGNAGQIDLADIEEEFSKILLPDEKLQQAYKVIRDLIVFTDRRLILVDKQGITGSKKEFMSIPYRSIVRFSAETKGHFDLESDLHIWLSSTDTAVTKTFSKDGSILEVQKALALYCCR
ncbi:MAG: PH domain-containing protein [Gammaproteobacteria bacterium]|nr:PH domain-containing protein [Gammaproteobacteria bacterium]MBU2056696.1 PH domain-containing protein [Gammaproteobacteria bacterium]MBU2174033.1 PH domain-containing protein [Gammaproteobacteria bacterium]MBU2247339.1 PH domain-containing protein [Gammaproteobacteria bacterium]MBU2345043.1 PH domain-containing protein [Gammaproteobacteria bacterium]